jgi:arginine/lysine/ornithine decarboxylase
MQRISELSKRAAVEDRAAMATLCTHITRAVLTAGSIQCKDAWSAALNNSLYLLIATTCPMAQPSSASNNLAAANQLITAAQSICPAYTIDNCRKLVAGIPQPPPPPPPSSSSKKRRSIVFFSVSDKEAEGLMEQHRASQKRVRQEMGMLGGSSSTTFKEELDQLIMSSTSTEDWFDIGIGHYAPDARV